jgi:hypothetical protein
VERVSCIEPVASVETPDDDSRITAGAKRAELSQATK